MFAKVVLVVCAVAQTTYGSCANRVWNPIQSPCGWNSGYANSAIVGPAISTPFIGGSVIAPTGVASSGGGLPISSSSLGSPVGLSVISENVYEGTLATSGNLPFLGAVAVEGAFPTIGAGAVSYGCGDGIIGMNSEGPVQTGIASVGGVFPPTSPSAAATNAALNLGLGVSGYGSSYGLGNPWSGCGPKHWAPAHHNHGCGCATIL